MSEKRFTYFKVPLGFGKQAIKDNANDEVFDFTLSNVLDKLNEQQATITALKERLYDFEKRKIIEESEIDEDVIPKVKLLRAELFGEKYE